MVYPTCTHLCWRCGCSSFMCIHAAHFLQLASVHIGDEAPQEAKCHPSPQRSGSLHTAPHTIKLGAGADSSWYATGRLFCPACAKAVMPQGDFWQDQTILSEILLTYIHCHDSFISLFRMTHLFCLVGFLTQNFHGHSLIVV